MLAGELINYEIPFLHPNDTVDVALHLMNDCRVSHLPVITEKHYLGLVSEQHLLNAASDAPVSTLQNHFLPGAVEEQQHFLNAVSYSNQMQTTVVPVINKEQELTGVITSVDLLKSLGNFAGADEIGGIIVLEMKRPQFAISEISRIVESNDSTILHMNTTVHPENGLLTVTLHLNKKEISSIISTFERFEYDIVYYYGDENFKADIHDNFRHLMNYLDI